MVWDSIYSTLPKINTEPENYPPHLQKKQFSGSMLVFRGVWGFYYCTHYLADYLNTTQFFAGV